MASDFKSIQILLRRIVQCILIHYAGYAKHIGLYPGAGPIKVLSEELKGYKFAKGSIQFPLNRELPFELIQKIIDLKLKG